MISLILIVLFITIIYMTIVFIIAWRMKRLDVVDIAWGGAFIVIGLTTLSWGELGALQYVTTGLVVIWALRLGVSIWRRFRHSSGEDPRYKEMRRQWKSQAALRAYGSIFVVQAVLATIVSLSVIVTNLSYVHGLNSLAIIGLGVWLFGFLFESIGDAQLRRHLAAPKNKDRLMTSGLWRYTRHPNYFGEAVQWWGIFFIALSVPYGWATIIAPLTITVLLLFVSGVPLTEKRFEGRTGWNEYKRRTSVFIPWPPRAK